MSQTLYQILFPFLKGIVLMLRILPPEAFNRCCLFLPGRLIVYGLKHYGARIGEDTTISVPTTFHNFAEKKKVFFSNLDIGDHCYLGRDLFLDLKEKIVIENNVTLGMKVTIITHTDVGKSPLKEQYIPNSSSPVVIRKGAYIGANVTILQGVEIGEMSIIGAGAIVTQSVPPHTLYACVPSRKIKDIT